MKRLSLALLLLAAPAHAMTIVPTWDASVTSNANKVGIEAAVDTAMAAYTSVFTNPVTVNINVGWGEVGGVTMPGNYAGQGQHAQETLIAWYSNNGGSTA